MRNTSVLVGLLLGLADPAFLAMPVAVDRCHPMVTKILVHFALAVPMGRWAIGYAVLATPSWLVGVALVHRAGARTP